MQGRHIVQPTEGYSMEPTDMLARSVPLWL